MITNFENITHDLNQTELSLVPVIMNGFKRHSKSNPIKTTLIIKKMNEFFHEKGLKIKMTGPRLRKIVNYIRTNSLLPLCATSDGYFISNDKFDLKAQIHSLNQRANSISSCAKGLEKFINE